MRLEGMRTLPRACRRQLCSCSVQSMPRLTIVLDPALTEEAMRITGLKSRRAVVDHALRELVRREKQREVLQLEGIGWEGDLSKMRESRFP